MIPNLYTLMDEIEPIKYQNKTYRIVFTSGNTPVSQNVLTLGMSVETDSVDRIDGYIDDLQSVIQAIYLILSIERYQFQIYSWNYGVELLDLIGKPMPYVMAELPRRIKEALTMDDRIADVVDFQFEPKKNKLHTTFSIVTDVGTISTQMEVSV